VESREIEVLLDCVLQVTGQNFGQDDLVTLLWEAHLEHIEIDYVPSDSDFGSGANETEENGDLVPWPTASAVDQEEAGAPGHSDGEEHESSGRSDDWTTGDLTVEIEAGYEELEALSKSEVERFRREYEAEHQVSQVTTALAIMRAYIGSG